MRDFWLDWRGEWKIALAILAVLAGVIGYVVFRQSGPATFETATIIRFGSYANDIGNHPSVIVRMPDGSTAQVFTLSAQLDQCSIGSRIRLVRKPNSLNVQPRGCS